MKTTKKSKLNFLKKFSHIWVLIYVPIYMYCFTRLEETTSPSDMTLIHLPIDDVIPFCEYFIVPYLFWFVYIFAVGVFQFFYGKPGFYRYCVFLFSGMTLSLIIYALWPNGIHLRPDLASIPRDNIFMDAVAKLYEIDTPTNVCPSIHVLNSIGATVSLLKNEDFSKKLSRRIASIVTCVLICLSTVFLKQHSCFDVVCALVMSVGLYVLAYNPKLLKIEATVKEHEKAYT